MACTTGWQCCALDVAIQVQADGASNGRTRLVDHIHDRLAMYFSFHPPSHTRTLLSSLFLVSLLPLRPQVTVFTIVFTIVTCTSPFYCHPAYCSHHNNRAQHNSFPLSTCTIVRIFLEILDSYLPLCRHSGHSFPRYVGKSNPTSYFQSPANFAKLQKLQLFSNRRPVPIYSISFRHQFSLSG